MFGMVFRAWYTLIDSFLNSLSQQHDGFRVDDSCLVHLDEFVLFLRCIIFFEFS